ncbi:flagellar hook assembly protein FlgD [Psychromarinibacter sp. S121]|uniref:flagellar hook assembly protein FlgD n=1 Tax=Psychromarinibacter sp. S121 TaxID=3415127 RepID=UPI003C7AE978
MSISTVSAATVTTTSESTLSQLGEDYETFLGLLVAQVQNQDPLEPMDATQFVSQIATLTQVEQSVNMNAQLEQLRSSLALTASMSEASLIGRTVSVPSDTITLHSEGMPLAFGYELEGTASAVSAVITDASGNVVRTIGDLSTATGVINDVVWDGYDANGDLAPVGTYQISLTATDATGGYNTYVRDTVNSVSYVGGQQILNLADGTMASSGDIVMIE